MDLQLFKHLSYNETRITTLLSQGKVYSSRADPGLGVGVAFNGLNVTALAAWLEAFKCLNLCDCPGCLASSKESHVI